MARKKSNSRKDKRVQLSLSVDCSVIVSVMRALVDSFFQHTSIISRVLTPDRGTGFIVYSDKTELMLTNPSVLFADLFFSVLFCGCLLHALLPFANGLTGWSVKLFIMCWSSGIAIELLTLLPSQIGNFYHANFLVNLFWGAEPFYMLVGVYGSLPYLAIQCAVLFRLGNAWAQACLASLIAMESWSLLDSVGLRLLWWSWHESEPLYAERDECGVPVVSTFWIGAQVFGLALLMRSRFFECLPPFVSGPLFLIGMEIPMLLILLPFGNVGGKGVFLSEGTGQGSLAFMGSFWEFLSAFGLEARVGTDHFALLLWKCVCALSILPFFFQVSREEGGWWKERLGWFRKRGDEEVEWEKPDCRSEEKKGDAPASRTSEGKEQNTVGEISASRHYAGPLSIGLLFFYILGMVSIFGVLDGSARQISRFSVGQAVDFSESKCAEKEPSFFGVFERSKYLCPSRLNSSVAQFKVCDSRSSSSSPPSGKTLYSTCGVPALPSCVNKIKKHVYVLIVFIGIASILCAGSAAKEVIMELEDEEEKEEEKKRRKEEKGKEE